jgi:hypothetical protein
MGELNVGCFWLQFVMQTKILHAKLSSMQRRATRELLRSSNKFSKVHGNVSQLLRANFFFFFFAKNNNIKQNNKRATQKKR